MKGLLGDEEIAAESEGAGQGQRNDPVPNLSRWRNGAVFITKVEGGKVKG